MFFSVYKLGMNLNQWMMVIGFSIIMIPVSLFTKFLIFNVFKFNDGEDDLEEESDETSEEMFNNKE